MRDTRDDDDVVVVVDDDDDDTQGADIDIMSSVRTYSRC
jgi:hypothetical protein